MLNNIEITETNDNENTDNMPSRSQSMSLYEFARWAALVEAVDLIAEKCADRGIDFYGPVGMKYIKPLDIQDYVDNRADMLQTKLKTSRDLEKAINNIKCLQIENQLKLLEIVE